MDIRPITPTYAVSPQIWPSDVPEIKDAGYTVVICNRPDAEIPDEFHAEIVRREVEKAGMKFVLNPIISGNLTQENIDIQANAMAEADGPVFAYCASGNRCSIVWALTQAGRRPTDELIGLPARFGYQLEWLRAKLDTVAQRQG